MPSQKLIQQAHDVLNKNDLGEWTRPTAGLYPHQWLWDSCFIAIGLRHIDVKRAQQEIRSLLKGQWHNGMIPHVIFSDADGYHAGPSLWKAHVNPNCPPSMSTTGITQPPMVAEAVVRIGEKLSPKKRREWYEEVYPALARYHEWLYRERDPYDRGLITVVHPWESGLDNSPPWMEALHTYAISKKLWLLHRSRTALKFIERFRKDTALVPAEERMSTLDLLAIYELIKQLRSYKYDQDKILRRYKLHLVDVAFNAILIRANEQLYQIAHTIKQPLPPLVARAHAKKLYVLDSLWDEQSGLYYCRDDRRRQLIKLPTIASFLPLYAGVLPKDRADSLVKHMHDATTFHAGWPIPSTPLDSPYFKPHCYWQGPVWVNMNWLIIDGLERNGYSKEAKQLRASTLRLVRQHGMNEYFSPMNGTASGSSDFSWTASLVVDLLER